MVVIGASPLVGILTKRRVPSVLAYIIWPFSVIVIVILALLFLMSFMIFQTRDLLPQLQDQLTALEQDFVDTLAGWGFDISGVIEEQILKPENVIGWASSALSALVGALRSMSLIVFIVAYMLVEVSGFRKRFYEALGEDRPALRRWLQWTRETRSYLWITTVLAALVAILNFALLWALGVPYPFTWAFLSFVMSYIPNVGFLIALVPPLTLAILQRSWGMVIGVLVGYIAINFVAGQHLQAQIPQVGHGPARGGIVPVGVDLGFRAGTHRSASLHTHDHDGKDHIPRSLARDRAARPAAAIRGRSCATRRRTRSWWGRDKSGGPSRGT